MSERRISTYAAALVVLALAAPAGAQEVAAAEGDRVEPVRLIDCPTAGLVAKGRFSADLRFFPQGGVMGQLNAGALDRLSIGLSFGGEQIIGDQEVDWYPRVEPTIRYRVLEESQALPALVLGYETQGYGLYCGGRYQIKSKGMFLAASKNYTGPLGQFGVHGGLNLSREDSDEDGDLSGWVGLDKSINAELGLVAEYDLATNDNDHSALGSGEGYLNLGAHWSVVPSLNLSLLLKNVLGNGKGGADCKGGADLSRELAVRYTEEF
ncbi:MAG: hypothetical protein FJY95_02545 [Candidatus Handelsmanbacteria bacterium]|nr:hypothetical protein [Candidatus Handelsmanbacteria bacterium]